MRRAPGTGSVYKPRWRPRAGAEQRESRLYWIAYRVGPELIREPAHTANRQEAETLLRTRLSALDRGEAPAIRDRATFDDLATWIRDDYRANGRRSGLRLELSLRHLADAFGDVRAAAITTDRVTRYAARRLDEGAARGSVNRELAALKRAFRLAQRAGRLTAAPYVPMLREGAPREGFFERPDFERLRGALPADLRPFAVTAYVTGWRVPSEVLTRQWRHLDLRASWLRLEPGETKGGRGRLFPLTPELRQALQAQRRATNAAERRLGRVIPWIFHHDGLPLVYRAKKGHAWLASPYLRRSWAAACKAAGLAGRIPHDFRRTATRDLLRAGVPTHVVMAALGWQTQAMLLRYAIVDEGALVEAGKKRAKLRQ